MYSISVIIPTLNSEALLRQCLSSIASQTYPSRLVTLMIVDGGSTDKTLTIANAFGAIIVNNPLKTAEAAKAKAMRMCSTDLVALIDSDNILPNDKWLEDMVLPFTNTLIQATEPMFMCYRHTDGYITRYCALMGLVDPVCFYVGNYDRWNIIDKAWTRLKLPSATYDRFTLVLLQPNKTIPTIGANGTIIRTRFAQDALDISNSAYYFDVDIFKTSSLFQSVVIAKIPTSIVHIYSTTLSDVARKQSRRINDYFYFTSNGQRSSYAERGNWHHYARFCIDVMLFFPMIFDVIRGMKAKPDMAWLAHIPICYITLAIYAVGTIKYKLLRIPASISRSGWKQAG